MTFTVKNILSATVLVAILAVLTMTLGTSYEVQSASFGGSAAYQQTATTTVVGPEGSGATPVTIFANETARSCSSRIISTTDGTGQDIYLLFGDPINGDIASTSLGLALGHYQAASTTVVYDGGTFGCNRWTVYSEASTTLMLSGF